MPQLYLHRRQGVVTSRARQLCGFTKVWLAPGEARALTIPIPRESLAQWALQMRHRVLPGRVEWFLCDSGRELLAGEFTLA